MSELTKVSYLFEDCVAHAGPMALLNEQLLVADGRLQASVTITPASVFADERGVPAWVGIEYMAQATAAYAGVQARQKGETVKLGFLVGSRRYTSTQSYFHHGQTLIIEVAEEMFNTDGLSVLRCTISEPGSGPEPGTVIASANLNVFQPKDPSQHFEEARGG